MAINIRTLGTWNSLSLALVFACSGCGEAGKPWDQVYAVSGVVKYKGKPVKDAELTFFPVDDKVPEAVRPWAKSSENGEFVLSTYDRGDGAPAGKYKATVVHHEIVISGGSMGTKPNDLPKKYSNRATTDLIVEVKEGETKLPAFDLK